jgi:hypothetical protein
MGKGRKWITATISIMTLFAIIILMFYYYWTHRVDPLDTSAENLSEFEKIMNEDYIQNYPETPREVVKNFARIMRVLYNDPKDDEVEPLALKIRELYDNEFLQNNPEDTYLNNLYSDIASWQEKKRRITNYLLVKEDQEQESEVNGVKYSVNYVSYTIQENGKFTETWKVLLRQDEDKRWKILGWEFVPEEDSQD